MFSHLMRLVPCHKCCTSRSVFSFFSTFAINLFHFFFFFSVPKNMPSIFLFSCYRTEWKRERTREKQNKNKTHTHTHNNRRGNVRRERGRERRIHPFKKENRWGLETLNCRLSIALFPVQYGPLLHPHHSNFWPLFFLKIFWLNYKNCSYFCQEGGGKNPNWSSDPSPNLEKFIAPHRCYQKGTKKKKWCIKKKHPKTATRTGNIKWKCKKKK